MIEYKDKVIPLAAIVISPMHRMRPISAEDRREIGSSLAKFGQLQQILVRPAKGKRKDIYELLAGRMRYEAMKAERIRLARCAVCNVDDRTAEIVSIIENLHRRVNEEADRRRDIARYGELIAEDVAKEEASLAERHKVSGTAPKAKRGRPPIVEPKVAAKTAEDLKISETKAKEILQIQRNLCPSASRALDRGKITQEQALALSRMRLGKQREELQRMLDETQRESRERLAQERRSSPTVNATEATVQMLKRIVSSAQSLFEKADELISYTKGKAIDWDVVRKVDVVILREAGNTLLDLQGIVSTDQVD